MDLGVGKLRITRGLQRVPGPNGRSRLEFFDVKTQRSRREIVLPGFAVERLRSHRKEQTRRRLAFGAAWMDLDLVCERGDGRPIDPGDFSQAFKQIGVLAKVHPKMRLHDVRHGVATALLGEGVHPAITSAVLGHSSPAFTMAVYQHVLDGMTAGAAVALEHALVRSLASR
jgi:integrase